MNYLSTKLRLIILGATKVFNDKKLKLFSIKQEVLGIHTHVLEIENNIHHFIIKKTV